MTRKGVWEEGSWSSPAQSSAQPQKAPEIDQSNINALRQIVWTVMSWERSGSPGWNPPPQSLSNSSVFSTFSYFLPLGVNHFLCDLKENSFFTTVICSYLCPVDPHFDWGREICRLLRSFSFSCLTFSPSQWELFDYIDPRCGSLLLILNLHLITWMRPGWSCSSLELLMLVSAAPTRPGPALDGHRIPLPPSLRLEPPSPLEPAAAFSGS